MGFERQLLTPGVFHQIDNHSVLGVEAILAYQSFGTSRLGMQAFSAPQPGRMDAARLGDDGMAYWVFSPTRKSGYGTGVRP